MIKLENVSKSYGKQQVLSGFSLDIKKGERVAIMGRSGAGKTTLINLILGLIKPDSGTVTISKDAVFGTVFQEDRLIESLSAVGNVSVVQKRPPTQDGVIALLEGAGLSQELIYKPANELSGGERRRVCIARALATDADIFIFDEPFKGIDEGTLEKVTEAVAKLTEGKTFILITHSKDEAARLCDKIIEI